MIHICLVSGTVCGYAGRRLTFGWIIRHYRIAGPLLSFFGCRDCLSELRETMRTARSA